MRWTRSVVVTGFLISLPLLSFVACGDDGSATTNDGPSTGGGSTTGPGATSTSASGSTSGPTTTSGSGGAGGGSTESPGCTDGRGLEEGEHTFQLDGFERRYILRLPANYSPDVAWPVVLALHGNGGSVSYWDATSGPQNIRAVLQNEAILIVVEAIEGNWRDYAAPPETWPERIELELAYFEEVLTQAKNELCVDTSAIFSMGFSGGGSFSGVLGCRREDIRAIAVGGSVIYFEEADCQYTPAAWITIGTEELSPEREAFRDFFRDRAGCDATNMPTPPDPCVAYDGCGAATPVHYCQHPDGHIWPGFGSEAMWGFFSTFVD
jgi:predicted esterase